MRKLFFPALTGALVLGLACVARAQSPVQPAAPSSLPAQPGSGASAPPAPAESQATAVASLAGVVTTPCGNSVAPPANLPPAGSGPVVWILEVCFPKQGNTSSIESETYMYYIKLRGSQPSQGVWIPYNDATEQTIVSDFKALWGTKFLEDLSIEKTDYV